MRPKTGPIFGGTSPTDTATTDTTTDTTKSTTTDTTTDTTKNTTTDNPIEKLTKDPAALTQLLSQVDSLTKNLKTANDKVTAYEAKQQEEARKQQTKEQQLESDLAERDKTIQQMDAVIQNMAVNNAFLSQPDIQWNSVKQAMAELDSSAFEVDIDLASGKATVSGIENEVKRIAKDFPWLIKSAQNSTVTPPATPRQQPTRSGPAPSVPGTEAEKAAKRSDLMKRFPAIVRR